MISTITWNCRGLGDRQTRLHLKEMVKIHRPTILALMETKIQSHHVYGFLASIGFTDMVVVEASGFVGGLWFLWDNHRITVEPLAVEDQVTTVLVSETTSAPWLLSVVYASPRAHEREDLWV